MKRIFLLLALSLSGTGILTAKEITTEQARQTATRFWQSAPATRATTPSWRLVHPDTDPGTRSTNTDPAYYIFDNENGPGFVIVAGDDVAMPVLGYSFGSEFPSGSLPGNLRDWLNGIRETVNRARSEGLKAESNVARAWSSTRSGSTVVKLETALWDQSEPYNRLCPLIGEEWTYTGCTATATAIAMRYHKWPERGTGTLPAYTTTSYRINIEETPLGHAYDWDNMPLKYGYSYYQTSDNNIAYEYTPYNETQATAVATLMRDCAVMLRSDFGPNGSAGTSAFSADIPRMLVNHMGYDKQTRWVSRESYLTAEWNQLIQNELNNDRPIIYCGYNPTAGHAFILDGYTDDNYYSVNWGWSGYCNGYFLLTALDPAGQGAGGSDHFNDNQNAIIGMQRDKGNSAITELRYLESYVSEEERTYNGITAEGNIAPGNTISLYVGFICNFGSMFSGEILLAVTDQENRVIKEIVREPITDFQEGYGFNISGLPFYIDIPLLPGYRIRTLYKRENTDQWSVVRGNEEKGCVWDLLIGDPYTIEESTRLTYNRISRTMHLEVKQGVSATLQALDGTDYSSLCQNGDLQIDIDASTLPGGTYLLILQKGAELKELRIKLSDPNE